MTRASQVIDQTFEPPPEEQQRILREIDELRRSKRGVPMPEKLGPVNPKERSKACYGVSRIRECRDPRRDWL